MRESGRKVLLLGSEAEFGRVTDALCEGGYEALGYSDFETFMSALLRMMPEAVVVWGSRCREEVEAAIGVLRHHVASRRSPLVLAIDRDRADCELAETASAVIETPVKPEALLELLDRLVASGAESVDLPRVLVVDDDENIVLLGSHVVSGLGMIPLVAFDGPEAVVKAKQLRPDVILLDINMPQMDGFRVIELLKAEPVTSMLPIIVFSARKSEEDKVRALKLGADDYVVKPFNISELGARIDRLLNRTRTGVSASSTTGLPGNVSVEQVLVDRISGKKPFAVLYVDADHFKSFNDCYGFFRGDSVLRQIADIILDACRSVGGDEDFVGHIGGDDFVAVTDPECAEAVARSIIERFDRIIPYYYDPADRERGAIVTADRRGQQARFPLMTLSIAVVSTAIRAFHHAGEVADVAAQVKKVAKRRTGSVWLMDQRSDG